METEEYTKPTKKGSDRTKQSHSNMQYLLLETIQIRILNLRVILEEGLYSINIQTEEMIKPWFSTRVLPDENLPGVPQPWYCHHHRVKLLQTAVFKCHIGAKLRSSSSSKAHLLAFHYSGRHDTSAATLPSSAQTCCLKTEVHGALLPTGSSTDLHGGMMLCPACLHFQEESNWAGLQ